MTTDIFDGKYRRRVGELSDNSAEKFLKNSPEAKLGLRTLPERRRSKLSNGEIHPGVKDISVRLLDYPDKDRFGENLARLIEGTTGVDPDRRFSEEEIKKVWDELSHVFSPNLIMEHAALEFEISGSTRINTHQLVRTRLGAYMQQESRTCYLGNEFNVRMPLAYLGADKHDLQEEFKEIVERLRAFYQESAERGIPLEDARYLAPIGIETFIIARYPLNAWLATYARRACPLMQWEICWIFRQMKGLLEGVWPQLAQFAKIHCEFSHKCHRVVAEGHKPKELCEFEWAGEF